MTSISETLFDTYGDSLMQEYAPYDEAEILAALDRMSMPQDMQIQVCDLLSSCYLRWGTAAFAIGLGLGLSLMQDCSGRRLRTDGLPCAAPQFMYPGISLPGRPESPAVLRLFRQRPVPFTARPAPGCW